MIKLLSYIAFLLAVCGIYWCVHTVIRASRYAKEERYLHCRYLAVYLAALFVLCNRYTFTYWLLAVDKIINFRPLQAFWNLVLPMRRFELVYLVVTLLIVNLMLLLGVGILFLIMRIIFPAGGSFLDTQDMGWMQKAVHFPWVVTNNVSEMNKEEGKYQVTARGFIMSLWAERMKYVFALLQAAEIIFISVGIYSASEWFAAHTVNLVEGWYMLPIAGYVLFEQIQYFLEGNVDYEAGTYGSEAVSEHLEGDMKALMALYCEEFRGTEALIGTKVLENRKVCKDGLVNNGLSQDQKQTCEQPEVLEMLDNQLREIHIRQNSSFQNALISLLNGNSINVRDYIQGEFLIYLAAYMNFYISQEKTFMILCKSKTEAALIKRELAKALNQINKIYSIWKIADIDGADSNEEMSILVCSYRDFVNHRLIDKRADFFADLSAVVLCDSVEFCAQGNVQKEIVFAELSKVRHFIQFILMSEIDSDSLRTSFEYYTNQELHPFKNDQLRNRLYLMLWAEDSIYKIQQAQGIGGIQSPYLGVSIPLALLAVKYDFPRVKIFSSDGKGYHTYQDAMTMSYQEILGYLGCGVDLNKMLVFNSFSLAKRQEMEMLILYDSEYNFLNTLWAWMKYGGTDATMIHVISPAYMLREYFAANLNEEILRNNDFDAFISYRSGLKTTRFLALLLELCNAGVDETELMKKNQEYGWGYENVTELLSDCLRDVLNTKEFYNIFECFRFEEEYPFDMEKDCYVHKTIVKLSDENIRRRIKGKLEFTKLVSKNNVVEELPVLKGNAYNTYLRGQVVPINGHMHRILNVKDGMVFVEQTMPTDKRDYLQVSEFAFSNMRKTDECVDMDVLDFNLYSADVERKIYGYWASLQDVAFRKPGALRLYDVKDLNEQPVSVHHHNIQVLQMKLRKDQFGERAKEAELLIAFMLREMFKTLYPVNHRNLFAVTEFDSESDYWDRLFEDSEHAQLEDKVRSIVSFSKNIDTGEDDNEEYICIYVVEFSSLEMGILTSLSTNYMKVFQMMASYLEWYLKENTQSTAEKEKETGGSENTSMESGDSDIQQTEEQDTVMGREKKAVYLNLGGEDIAPCFAPEEVLAFCRRILSSHEKPRLTERKGVSVKEAYVCSFCGKTSIFSYHMDDGRKMCRSCKQQQIGQREEIKELYLETVDFLCKGYKIRLRKNIHLRLKSAEAIREHCKSSGGGRILGFYQHKNHELWIEARGPKNAVRDTMIHELTHAWQFDNLNVKRLYNKHPKDALKILEGHASYMEVDAMRKLGEDEYADYLEAQLMLRNDEYGEGFRMLKKEFEAKEQEGSHLTPYKVMEELVNKL